MAIQSKTNTPMLALYGFIAGFIATLVFFEIALAILWGLNIAPFGPFNMAATQPFGVPATFSLAFWGGVWGILYALVHDRFPHGAGYWVTAFLFGAILTSLVALLIVFPLKGQPVAGGGNPWLLLTAFLINGAWGVGTGIIVKAFTGGFSKPRNVTA